MKQVNKKKKKKKLFRGEAKVFFIIGLILLAIPICNVYTKAILSESSIALEEIKNDIKDQESVNESLKMEISELASLDKIQNVVKDSGLTYQNNNIKVVTSEE